MRRSRRGLDNLVGGKRPFRKRTCRSKSRCGGGGDMHTQMFSPGSWYRIGGPLRIGGRRTRRSRRGGAMEITASGGHFLKHLKNLGGASRRVRRSRSRRGGGKRTFRKRTCRSKSRCGGRGEYGLA